MNGPTHAVVGGVVSAGTYFYLKRSIGEEPDPIEGVLFGLGGIGFGLLPDLLEPATSPRHRSFFHSAAFVVLAYLAYRQWVAKNITDRQIEMALKAFGLAYCSHLALDASTPMGLPLLCSGI